MCRMIAVISQEPARVSDYLPHLEKQARHGVMSPHRDGYGVAIAHAENIVVMKETAPVWSRTLDFAGQQGRCLILHARQASKGNLDLANAHPFLHKSKDGTLALAHNGTIRDAHKLGALDATASDTQIFFDLLVREYIRRGDLGISLAQTVSLITQTCQDITALNTLATDGSNLAITRYCTIREDYYTLFYAASDTTAIVSTEKFDLASAFGPWTLLDNKAIYTIQPDTLAVKQQVSF